MTLETIALWWCYAFGAAAALLLLAVAWLAAIDRLVELFKVKRAILDWAWHRATVLNEQKITTTKAEFNARSEQ